MNFKELNEKEISDFIMQDPKLAYLGFSDAELDYMYKNKEYPINPTSCYVGVLKDDELVCILKWEGFTDYAISIHLYISSEFHGTGMLKEVNDFLYKHFQDNTKLKKI